MKRHLFFPMALALVIFPAISFGGEIMSPAPSWRFTTKKPDGAWTAIAFNDNAWTAKPPPYGCRSGLPEFQQSKVKTTWETPDI